MYATKRYKGINSFLESKYYWEHKDTNRPLKYTKLYSLVYHNATIEISVTIDFFLLLQLLILFVVNLVMQLFLRVHNTDTYTNVRRNSPIKVYKLESFSFRTLTSGVLLLLPDILFFFIRNRMYSLVLSTVISSPFCTVRRVTFVYVVRTTSVNWKCSKSSSVYVSNYIYVITFLINSFKIN